MPRCSTCNEELNAIDDATRATGMMCASCRERLGVIPMGAPIRDARPCVRCNSQRFTRVIPREHAFLNVDMAGQQAVATPMTATAVPQRLERFFSAAHHVWIDARKGAGVLEMYICHGCGHVEWFCRDAASIPTGPQYMAEIVDYGATTPYR
jgi:hypothetical protein